MPYFTSGLSVGGALGYGVGWYLPYPTLRPATFAVVAELLVSLQQQVTLKYSISAPVWVLAQAWSLRYSPRDADGNGRITVTLDGAAQTLDLRPGDRKLGATFDRFGFFNVQSGGHFVYVYVDDVTYTARRM